MDIKELLMEYGKVYNEMYNTHSEMMDVIESNFAGAYDDAMKDADFKAIIIEAAKLREDPFISDRERAAIIMAYMIVSRREAIKRAVCESVQNELTA